MKKFIFIVPLMAVSLLASCNNGGGGDIPDPTVVRNLIYVYDNGTDGTFTEKYIDNEKTKAPSWTPTYDGHTFDDWYLNKQGEGTDEKFTFGSALTDESTTIHAHWNNVIPTTYTVTFNANGGTLDEGKGALPEIKGITSGKLFYEIADFTNEQTASKENHTFVGWGLSPNTPDKIEDSYRITDSFTAYAIFNPVSTATITLTDDSANCKLYYGGSLHDIGIPFNIPANEDVVLTVEPNNDYLPVFKENLTFTGASGSTGTFNPAKKEITVNLKPNSNNTIYATTSPLKENLEAYDWNEIKTISENGVAPLVFKVGDDKTIILKENGTDQSFAHTVRIIDFNHDKDSEGNDLGITFEFENVITGSNGSAVTKEWNKEQSTSSTNYDYRASTLNTFLNNDVLSMLPSSDNPSNPNLKEVIKPVDKKVGVNESKTKGSQYYTATSFDGVEHPYPYLFPLALNEIADNESGVTEDEGYKYQYYIDHPNETDRIKRKAGETTGNGEDYWLRSPIIDGSYNAWCVRFGGYLGNGIVYNDALAVAPAFYI